MGVKINPGDLSKLKNKLDKMRAFSKSGLSRELGQTGLEIVAKAKGGSPVDTGKLRQSIKAEKKGKSIDIVAGAKYAPYIEFGTGGNVTLDDMLALGIPPGYAAQFKGKGKGNIQPQPFFFSAARIGFKNLLSRLNNKIKDLS